MRCRTCAYENAEGSAFCNRCGRALPGIGNLPAAPPPPLPPVYLANTDPRTSGLAVAGFTLSFFCGILGLIFSLLALTECRNSGGAIRGHGLATAGVVISILNILLGVLYAIV